MGVRLSDAESGSELARTLMRAGLLDSADLVDGRVAFRDASSRNLNTLVSRAQGPAYFVKRAALAAGELGREAAWYQRLADTPSLRSVFPTLLHRDMRGYLVFETEEGAIDLLRHHRRLGAFPVALGEAVGRALGLLHRVTRLAAPRIAPELAPPTLLLHRPRLHAMRELTPASVELVRTIQRHPFIGEALDALRDGWSVQAITHQDVKWPNILVVRSAEGSSSVRLIDLEHMGEGDPAWDVGSALAGYVSFWVYSVDAVPDPGSPAAWGVTAGAPLESARPAIRACWTGYLAEARIPANEIPALLDHAVSMVAVRLVRTAFEATEMSTTVAPGAAMHLQVAANILREPAAAAVRLLGLGFEEPLEISG